MPRLHMQYHCIVLYCICILYFTRQKLHWSHGDYNAGFIHVQNVQASLSLIISLCNHDIVGLRILAIAANLGLQQDIAENTPEITQSNIGYTSRLSALLLTI